MKSRNLTFLTGLAFLSFSISVLAHDCINHKNQNHKHCDDNNSGGNSIVYTAELNTGAFEFDPVVIEVTPNSMANTLRSTVDLDMVRPAEALLQATWNAVFNTCVELLEPDSVTNFFVAADDWNIQKAGGVRVVFYDIRLQDAEVTVQLIGNEFDFIIDQFLPEPGPNKGDTSTGEFSLDQAAIYGSTVKGVHPRSGCQPHGGGSFDVFDLNIASTLVITATRQ